MVLFTVVSKVTMLTPQMCFHTVMTLLFKYQISLPMKLEQYRGAAAQDCDSQELLDLFTEMVGHEWAN